MVSGCGEGCGALSTNTYTYGSSMPYLVGPFLLCGDGRGGETVYFTVDESDMTLQITDRRILASSFFVIMSDDKIYDFHIIYLRGYNTADLRRKSVTALFSKDFDSVRPLHYYLSTPLSVMGWNAGPLKFELNPKRSDTMFHLQSRLKSRNPPPEGLGPWVQGRESYFINCYRRFIARDGYIAVKRSVLENNEVEFVPMCVPSRSYSGNYYMIFRLLPVPSGTIDELDDSALFHSKLSDPRGLHEEVFEDVQDIPLGGHLTEEPQEILKGKQEVSGEEQEMSEEEEATPHKPPAIERRLTHKKSVRMSISSK